MAAVVRPRREFVDDDVTVHGLEQLDTHDTERTGGFSGADGDLRRAVGECGRHRGRNDHLVADVVALDGFDDRVRQDLPGGRSRDHHREFAAELDERLEQHAVAAIESGKFGHRLVAGRARGVAVAVVSEGPRLHHHREPEAFDGRVELGRCADDDTFQDG